MNSPILKIVIGIIVVAGSVALVQLGSSSLGNVLAWQPATTNAISAVAVSLTALLSYQLLFRYYEKRKITELSRASFGSNAILGFATGFLLQSATVLVIYLAGAYSINTVNPLTYLLPSFITALSAGFVAEILIRGVFFRLLEQQLGTNFCLIISAVLFTVLHMGNKNATILSTLTVAIQAGILLPAVFVYSRNLWLGIFLHLSWDFTEPGIYGGINPGNSIPESLFSSSFTGSPLLTGGATGPGSSLPALLFCLAASLLFLWLANRKNNFIAPSWLRKTGPGHNS